MNMGGLLQLIVIDDQGRITDAREEDVLPRILRSCWTPSGDRVLAFTDETTPDAQELVETILGAGHDIKCLFTTPKLLESLALRLE